ncbi:hypothetical protein ACWCXB_34420 [Streptomyces sp. NPDC001514]
MKRARQHGKPAPPEGEELKREILDAELELTERLVPLSGRGEGGEALTSGRRAEERTGAEESDR